MAPSRSSQARVGATGTLIKTGPKDVEVSKKSKKGGNSTILPTTERALVLRNGKHGARGTGELFLVSKMTGREKLDLLAEDLIEKSKTAIATPFRLKECQKIAESQLSEYLDDITNLQDPDLFASIIEEELSARAQRLNDKIAPDQTRNPSFIGATIANRIHNTYLLASAWRIVAATLVELENDGVTDQNIVVRLREDEDIRNRYIALFDMVTQLVDLGQAKFSVLATSTPHYLQYFKTIVSDQGEEEIYFHWSGLKNAAESFLDSIIIELCFPRAPYPRAVLYDILRDAVQEAPKEAKRFPQSLWDSVGDLAYCVELQKILEAPLLRPEAEEWRKAPYQMPIEVENWVDAQILSLAAAERFANFKDDIYPLSKTKNPTVLQKMWKAINSNYKAVSGHESADSLWQLEATLLHPTPKWTYIRLKDSDFIDADDDDGPPKLQGKKKTLLAITSGDSDTDDGMPELQDVSDSSDEEAYTDSDDESESDGEGSESGYDTDREDEIRDMIREAMDTAAVDGQNWYRPQPDEENPFEEEDKKGNSFLKLLGSLRGRMFSPSSKLKSKSASRKPDASRIPKLPKMPKVAQTKPKPQTSAGVQGSLKTTIEEEEDEDSIAQKKKKKKKKPKKKKKKTDATDKAAAEESDDEEEPVAPKPPPAPAPAAPAAPPSPAPKAAKQPPPKPKAPSVAPSASTISLPIGETTAQSARSYLQSEHLDVPKAKVKTRSDQPSLFEKGKGLFTKFVGPEEKKKEPKSARRSWFSHLSRKARTAMHQLLNTSEDTTKGSTGMKWDTFVKLMTDMGFSVDLSTAGSSVRFDPPSGEDRAISFHKPHPDPTIDRITLKKWSKKLQKYYGWDRDDILI